jgi:hypothetical protein
MSRRRVFFMCIALLACLSGNAQDQWPDIAARLNALVSRQFPGTKCPGLFITVATNNEIIFSSALGKYHLIWCTKYRKKILRGRIAERARDLIRQICATVGAVDEAPIKACIENQKWDEDDDSFEITATAKP